MAGLPLMAAAASAGAACLTDDKDTVTAGAEADVFVLAAGFAATTGAE